MWLGGIYEVVFPHFLFIFLGQVTSAPAAAFQWLQYSFEWQWNYDAIGQQYRREHSGNESKLETFFLLYHITNHFIEFKDYLFFGKLVWFPEDNLFICTTAYHNWEDSLILISHFNVRGVANLFFTVKSNHRLWYIAFSCTWWDKGDHLLGYLLPPLAMFSK